MPNGQAMKAVIDRDARAALGIFARRHRFDLEAEIVQPRRAGKPGIEGGIQHARAVRQIAPWRGRASDARQSFSG